MKTPVSWIPAFAGMTTFYENLNVCRRFGAPALILAVLGLCGCQETGWVEVIVQANGLTVPEDLDELQVEVVGARTAVAGTCRAAERWFVYDEDTLDLPFSLVLITTGENDWNCAAVRVTGYLDLQPCLRTELLTCGGFSDRISETLTLEAACHRDASPAPPDCPAEEVCFPTDDGPTCRPSTTVELFNAQPYVPETCAGR